MSEPNDDINALREEFNAQMVGLRDRLDRIEAVEQVRALELARKRRVQAALHKLPAGEFFPDETGVVMSPREVNGIH